ncbi:murein hydrolase activator EnvC family protein [Euzebya rosea]|uniref:murein hydrolase activator EnvC family protein n=1 Tax=Euzebya rosea TaxID=2052804 RepID=UPI001300A63B|nr:M23 family metallopeptidase [Euzebya rosea]
MILTSSTSSSLRRVVLLMLVLAMAIATSGPASATGSEESRISETRQELERVRNELDAARGEADDDMIALEDADAQLEAVFTAVETAQQAVGRQQDAVADAERELSIAQGELVEQQQRMAQRINRLYRQARPDPLITVLDASTVSDAVEQSAYITAIGRQDRALVEGLENAQSRVEGRRRALDEEKVALDRVLVEQQALLVEVEEIRNDRELIAAASQDLVARLQSREEHLEEEAIELLRQQAQAEARAVAEAAAKEAAEQLAAEVTADDEAEGEDDAADIEEATAPPPAPAPVAAPSGGGGLQWPAGGTVTSGFGPRWGRNHNGIDIAAGSGSPIVAARGGTVTKAENWSGSGFGNVVIIAHGNGLTTLYAHMSSIAVSAGQSVSGGTYLGGMGCTGSCTGTHLHFEVWAGGTPVDPMGYL